MESLLGYFINPSLVLPGLGLLALPVIIHLINRMRYRRVRFAAMEFLLASQRRNRQRLLFEQLLLLLLRMLIVIGLVLLLSRLILDPAQLSFFRGARTQHVVLLDDSLSQREQWGDTSAFDEGVKAIRALVSAGASRPNTQELSLLLLSRPELPVFADRPMHSALEEELANSLDSASLRCGYRQLDLSEGLRAAGRYLSERKGYVQHLHVISDFRATDWRDQSTMQGAIEQLTNAGVNVNLVRTVGESRPNRTLSELTGAVQVAAAGVPLRLRVGVRNQSDQLATDVRVALYDDNQLLPSSLTIERIEPNTEVIQEIDIRFASPTKHKLRAELEADALLEDNQRFLAVDVSPTIPVLIINGNPTGDEAAYLADALAADPTNTGVSATVENLDALRRRPLDGYRCVMLMNVAELPADSIDILEKYVADGGGLVWYLGPQVRPAHYSSALYRGGQGLFPVPLAPSRAELLADVTNPGADLLPVDHPVFRVLAGEDNPFIKSVRVSEYFPVANEWVKDDQQRRDRVQTICRLRNQSPLMFEHRFGQGRVVTCLTTADPTWNTWALNPSYVVFQLELLKHVARTSRNLELRLVGEPIQLALDPAMYTDTIEITRPDGDQTVRMQATAETAENSAGTTATTEKTGAGRESSSRLQLRATYRETNQPGIYGVRLVDQSSTVEQRLLAYNVDPREGALPLLSSDELRKRIGDNRRVQIQEPGRLTWTKGDEVGSEVRRGLLWLLLAMLLVEQILAWKLSYHPPRARAAS